MFDRCMLHGMNVSAFDLNHVRALHFLLEEAHVARAARKLRITPAAASNALRRLRTDFDDPLLVRSGRTLVRTPRAEGLRGPAREVLAAAERLLDVCAPFEPSTHDGEFIVTTSDRVAEVLLPALDRLFTERAPKASLYVRTVTVEVETFLRDHGGIAIIPDSSRVRGLCAEGLFVEDFVCVLRKGHPLTKGPWTARRFAGAEHIIVAPLANSRRGVMDDLLAEQGLARRVTRVVTSFGLAVPLLFASDRIAILPQSFALARFKELDLVVRTAPLKLPVIEMQMVWYPGHERDPRHVWFRGLLRDAVRASGLRQMPP